MLPSLEPGQVLLGIGWFRPRVGNIVVASRPDRPLIKRITKIEGRLIWIEGDNRSFSTDSRHFGPIDRTALKARIIRILG
jgi:hypothetical protein